MPTGRARDLSNDQLAGIGVAAIAIGLVWTRRREIVMEASTWLQHHHITLAPGEGLFSIPMLGSLDLPRVLALVAVTGLVGMATVLGLRAGGGQPRDANRSGGARRQASAADELD